ncbi:MAG: glycoside hydrolase family 65 protein [Candidatus Freyrarchaeum guaymaensis]
MAGVLSTVGEDWSIIEEGLKRDRLPCLETLFTVGNGYVCVRGVLEEGFYDCYPGTYIAGIYDKNTSVSWELVNAPNPLGLEIRVDGVTLDIDTLGVASHERTLDLRGAVLRRRTVFVDDEGNRYEYASRRFFSIVELHLGVVVVELRSLDRDCTVTLRKFTDGGTENRVQPSGRPMGHYTVERRSVRGAFSYLEARTLDLGLRIGVAVGAVSEDGVKFKKWTEKDKVVQEFVFHAERGRRYRFAFYLAVHTSRETPDVKRACFRSLETAVEKGWRRLLSSHRRAWEERWRTCDIYVDDAEVRRALRFNMYHLLISAPPVDMDVSVGAKALTGEWYKGHVFWDTEVYVLPFFIYTQPRIARNLLMYRYRRLDQARERAKRYGHRGAFWPWESALSGNDVTPKKWINIDGTIIPVYTGEREIHICGAVVYAIWNYYTATGDLDFMLNAGCEMIFETARFWASRATPTDDGGYHIRGVIGPNEFQESVDNNAYTNFMARFTLRLGHQLYRWLAEKHPGTMRRISQKISLSEGEAEEWLEIAEKILFPIVDNGLIEEFEDYFELKDVTVSEWDDEGRPLWPKGVRLSEVRGTQLVKQADVVMLFHLFPDEFPKEQQRINLEYYARRTMHKSSLSPPSYALAYLNVDMREEAYHYFLFSLYTDLKNIYGNTQRGIHAATLGGTWQIMVHGFAGVRAKADCLSVNPRLPRKINHIKLRVWYRKTLVEIEVKDEGVRAKVVKGKGGVTVEHRGNRYTLSKDEILTVR